MKRRAEPAGPVERGLPAVGALDGEGMARTRARLDCLSKPTGSLGRLEALAVQLAGITGRTPPSVRPATVVVMAADHGVAAEGVSAYPAAVTAQMVRNFVAGGAAINVLGRQAGLRVVVVDVGVASGPGDERNAGDVCFRNCKIQPGTANLARRPAMTRQAALKAIGVGLDVAAEVASGGSRVLCLGEMGIGNTTAASALAAVLTGQPLEAVVGPGTGLDPGGVDRKRAVIRRALELHRPDPGDPLGVLAAVGGLEIAGLVGLILGAAAARLPVILDGFITGAAALVACRLEPAARDYLIAAHRSAEPGHRVVLESLGLQPLLALELRLGEGTGACLAFGLVEAAAAVVAGMATFDEAGVAGRLTGHCPAEARLRIPPAPVRERDPTVSSSEIILVLGGVRSGKSRHGRGLATARAAATGFPVLFLATGLATDTEMRQRIARHRRDRPPEWHTVEAREALAEILAGVDRPHVVLLDDLGFVASARLRQSSGQAGEGQLAAETVNEALITEIRNLLRAARTGDHVLIVVSNEVGMGVVPVSPAGRHFRDLVGAANQYLAQEADRVILTVAGIPIPLPEGRLPDEGDGHG